MCSEINISYDNCNKYAAVKPAMSLISTSEKLYYVPTKHLPKSVDTFQVEKKSVSRVCLKRIR